MQWIRGVSRLFARLGGLMIVLCAFLVSLDVAFRNLFKLAIFESFEITGYGIALAIVFGLSWALVTKAHIRIEALYNVLPLKPRAVLDVFAVGTLSVAAVALAYYAFQVVLDNIQLGARSNSTLHVPLAIPQGLWVVGLAWFAICSVTMFVIALLAVLGGRWHQVQALFGIASVAEEADASMEGTGMRSPGGVAGVAAPSNPKAGV